MINVLRQYFGLGFIRAFAPNQHNDSPPFGRISQSLLTDNLSYDTLKGRCGGWSMTTLERTRSKFLVADQVWIATALLQKEHPRRTEFSVSEIQERARKEGFLDETTNTFYVHANQHCVANRMPNPGNHRMLFETEGGHRRLYKPGDTCKPGRTGKITPEKDSIPAKYLYLLDWYSEWTKSASPARRSMDPLLRLRGSGKEIWKDEHADEYIRRLREGWE